MRGSRRVPRVSGIASAATMNAYTVTSSPATDSVTSRSVLICGSSPTGTSSVVIATNVASVRATSPPAASRTVPGRQVLGSVRVTGACSHAPRTASQGRCHSASTLACRKPSATLMASMCAFSCAFQVWMRSACGRTPASASRTAILASIPSPCPRCSRSTRVSPW